MYLGCPIFYTRRRKDYYQYLFKKVKAKLHAWKGKQLSSGGKATLITSVLQSMPVYLLSVLDPPQNILKHLHKIFARFFWSINEEGRSMHWASWQKLCTPKEEGGLGFRSLNDVSKEETYRHIFLTSNTTTKVWKQFMAAAGITEPVIQVKQVVRAWWNVKCCPKLQPLFQATPAIITLELWKKEKHKKCNTDGTSKGNPRPNSTGFCVRDENEDLVYAKSVDIGVTTNVVAEAQAILRGLEYCVTHEKHPLILETDSLTLKKVIEGEWDSPWCISAEFQKIKEMKNHFNMILQHIFREGNTLADFIANIVFSGAGTNQFLSFSELPSTGRRILNLDKLQTPNLRVRIAKRRAPD
ncbi:uncharacterized protein [Nicotiana tomentosiformis]|uniref:uncharacterized protein n=1 Tax=Nicotiana tomentosiformis TaxID=4098 RepID=UPI00388C4D38